MYVCRCGRGTQHVAMGTLGEHTTLKPKGVTEASLRVVRRSDEDNEGMKSANKT